MLMASPAWLPRPALLLLVTSLNSLVSLCEPGAGWLSGFRACDLRAVTTACNGKVRKHSSERLGVGGWGRGVEQKGGGRGGCHPSGAALGSDNYLQGVKFNPEKEVGVHWEYATKFTEGSQ